MFAAIYLPEFSLQCALRALPPGAASERSEPAALLDAMAEASQPKSVAQVVQLNRAAARDGVARGMTLAQAQARCGGLRLLRRHSRQERVAADLLLQAAGSVSPLLEETALGLCTLDLRRLPPRCSPPSGEVDNDEGPHRTWVEPLRARLAQAGLAARVGVADSPDLAALAACLARPFLALTGQPAARLADRPLSVLPLPPATRELLALWGMRTLGAFADLGRAEVALRLGVEALPWHDLASGRATERVLRLVRRPRLFCEAADFEHGVEALEALVSVLHRFLESLSRRLGDAYLVAASLDLELRFADRTAHQRSFQIPAPTREVEVLQRILLQHLEGLRAPAPVVGLILTARPSAPGGSQGGLLPGERGSFMSDPNRFGETLSRLGALVGEAQMGTPVALDTHRPDAFSLCPPDFSSFVGGAFTRPASDPSRDKELIPSAPVLSAPGPALRRFRPPRPTRVQVTGQGVPRSVEASASDENGRRSVVRAAGPWFSSGDWWENAAAWSCQEWEVELAGGFYRLAYDGTAWWLLGVYD